MSSPVESPAAPDDSIGKGVGRAILWQLGAIVVSLGLIWGVVQWLALIPVYLSLQRRGYPLAAKDLLITGLVGMLLNGTCVALLMH